MWEEIISRLIGIVIIIISNFTTALCGVELNSEMIARYNRFKDDQEAADEEQ